MKTDFLVSGWALKKLVGQGLAAIVVACLFIAVAQAQGDLDPSASEGSDPVEGTGAEQKSKGQLTLENLVGNAVRITSGDEYPELDKAIQRFKNGDGEGALEYLNQAKEKYPKLPPVDIILAKLQLAARNGKAVRALLERAAAENPEDPESYLMLADQAYVGGRTTESLALFEFVAPLVEKYSGNSFRKNLFEIRVIAGRSAVAERRKQWDESKALLEEWLERDPESPAAFQRLGVVMFNLKESRKALEHFRQAKKLDDNVGHPYVIMARLFDQQDNKLNAKKAFERAYKDDQADAQVAQAYAEWLIKEGELKEAKKVASTLRSQSPDSIAALLLDAIISLMQGDRGGAEEALGQVLSVDPSHAAATNILALLLIDSDSNSDRTRALQYAQMNAQRFGESVQANITLGWVLYNLNRKAEAQQALQKGLQAGNPTSNSAYLLARIMSDQEGQKDKAAAALENLLKNDKGLFLFRREAEELLSKLQQELN